MDNYEDMKSALDAIASNYIIESPSFDCHDCVELYICSACNKTFSSNVNLKQHMQIHSGENSLKCDDCSKVFKRKFNFICHKKIHEMEHTFVCKECGQGFTCKDKLQYHLRSYQNSVYACAGCDQKFCRKSHLKIHIGEQHSTTLGEKPVFDTNPYSDQVKYHKRKNALNIFSTTSFECCEDYTLDILGFLRNVRSGVENELKYQLYEKKEFKWGIELEVIVSPVSEDELSELSTLHLNSNSEPVFTESVISECIEQAFSEIITEFERLIEFEMHWSLLKIVKLDVFTAKY